VDTGDNPLVEITEAPPTWPPSSSPGLTLQPMVIPNLLGGQSHPRQGHLSKDATTTEVIARSKLFYEQIDKYYKTTAHWAMVTWLQTDGVVQLNKEKQWTNPLWHTKHNIAVITFPHHFVKRKNVIGRIVLMPAHCPDTAVMWTSLMLLLNVMSIKGHSGIRKTEKDVYFSCKVLQSFCSLTMAMHLLPKSSQSLWICGRTVK
jgi:hypothetical protein